MKFNTLPTSSYRDLEKDVTEVFSWGCGGNDICCMVWEPLELYVIVIVEMSRERKFNYIMYSNQPTSEQNHNTFYQDIARVFGH